MAGGAGARGAADAVDVILGVVRKVIVQNEFDPLHVDAARGDVRGDEDTIFAVAEPIERFAALAERAVGVQFGGGVTERAHTRGDLLRAMFGARKDEH